MKKYLKTLQSFTNKGFTLVELLVASLISVIVVLGASFGLMTIVTADREQGAESERRMELNRAIDFIFDDVREARRVDINIPPGSGWLDPGGDFTPIFYLEKPNGSVVAYYTSNTDTLANGGNWKNDIVVYRSTTSGSEGFPLLDGVAANPPEACPEPSFSGDGGFVVQVENNRSARLCLLGNTFDGKTYFIESSVSARSSE